jgi:hypothetical protein
MKPTMTMFVCMLAAGLATAQSPSVIQNTRNTMNAVRDNSAAASNQALGIGQKSGPASVSPAAAKGTIGVSPARPKSGKTGVPVAHKSAPAKPEAKAVPPVAETTASKPPAGGQDANTEDPSTSEQKYNANGRRDPFLSPVVSHGGGSGCSTGKKCLEIGQINLRGIVRADSGFIAVVSNGLNKAYFLRENDPVFNGYVVKITGDSIVFQETLQDHLGKTFTREVVKKITTPAV